MNEYKNTWSYKELIKKYTLDTYGTWQDYDTINLDSYAILDDDGDFYGFRKKDTCYSQK